MHVAKVEGWTAPSVCVYMPQVIPIFIKETALWSTHTETHRYTETMTNTEMAKD